MGVAQAESINFWHSLTEKPVVEVVITDLRQLKALVLEYALGWGCYQHQAHRKKVLIPPPEWDWVVYNFIDEEWEYCPPGTHTEVEWFSDWERISSSRDRGATFLRFNGALNPTIDPTAWRGLLQAYEDTYHWLFKTPFEPGCPYFAGLTPHGMSGFNGVPDYYAAGASLEIATCRAVLLTKDIVAICNLS